MSNRVNRSSEALIINNNNERVPVDFNSSPTQPTTPSVNPDVIINRYLDTVGDGTGNKNAIGDYSITQTIFKIQPPNGTIYRIAGIVVFVQDTGVFSELNYGAFNSPLTNGISIRIYNGTSTLLNITDNIPILTNGDWFRITPHTLSSPDKKDRWGVYIDPYGGGGGGISVNGTNSERLEFVLNDDFTGINFQTFYAIGQKET